MRNLIAVLVFVACTQAYGQPSDSVKLVKRIQTRGRFINADQSNRMQIFFEGSDKMRQSLALTDSEMFCFFVNHLKDDLELEFSLFEVTHSSGETERVRKITSIISLKNGDEFKDWRAKESENPERAERNHKALDKYLREKGLKTE